jgi:hypothetical protein
MPPLHECNMLFVDAGGDSMRFRFRAGCSAMNYGLDACMNGCICCVSNWYWSFEHSVGWRILRIGNILCQLLWGDSLSRLILKCHFVPPGPIQALIALILCMRAKTSKIID